MIVYKFGGASVKDANAVKNVVKIISSAQDDLVIVVSAMAKTTNALEEVVELYINQAQPEAINKINEIVNFHNQIVTELRLNEDVEFSILLKSVYAKLEQKIMSEVSSNFNLEYDQIVSFGEVISTTIISGYLNFIGVENNWLDARKIIRTSNQFRKAEVDWDETIKLVKSRMNDVEGKVIITQGFVGHTDTGFTTTLGREGSDFSAGILAYCLDAEKVIIWKDVPGMLNADPKYFMNCQKLNEISYREAIELSYFGASVIHPKTVKPLQNKNIQLWVKSFVSPEEKGTLIGENSDQDSLIPSYIFKANQALVSITPRDFSFVVEHNLSEIFSVLADANITVNLMQNSALSFSFSADDSPLLREAIKDFEEKYQVRYNENLSLLTVRHYTESVLEQLLSDNIILVEQKSRHTARYVLKSKD